jgi:lipoprotein-releasing system ATP-binding protein
MNNAGEELLRAEELVKDFRQGKDKLVVLKGLNLKMKRGEQISILGPSGAGKSTLLHLLAGLDVPSSGKIFFKDRDINRLNDLEKARFRNENIGFVYQFYHLLPEFTALENVCLPGLIYLERKGADSRKEKKAVKEKALEILTRVGLKERCFNRPGELSGGEQQRVAIARALINEPELILADEPTGNLDQATARGVAELIFSLSRENERAVILATHNETLAGQTKKIIRIVDGKIVV